MRVAMTLLKWPEAETRRLGKGIHDLRDNLHLCSRCGGLSATDPCDICKDENRSRDTLCLVNEWDSMLTLDEGGFYHGQYMILGGLLAPLANMDSDSLDLDRLISRLEERRRSTSSSWPWGPPSMRAAHGVVRQEPRPASVSRTSGCRVWPRASPWARRSNTWTGRHCASPCNTGRISRASRQFPDGKGSLAQGALSFFHARERRRPVRPCPGTGIFPQGRPAPSPPSRTYREGVFITPSCTHVRRLPFRGARQAAGMPFCGVFRGPFALQPLAGHTDGPGCHARSFAESFGNGHGLRPPSVARCCRCPSWPTGQGQRARPAAAFGRALLSMPVVASRPTGTACGRLRSRVAVDARSGCSRPTGTACGRLRSRVAVDARSGLAANGHGLAAAIRSRVAATARDTSGPV